MCNTCSLHNSPVHLGAQSRHQILEASEPPARGVSEATFPARQSTGMLTCLELEVSPAPFRAQLTSGLISMSAERRNIHALPPAFKLLRPSSDSDMGVPFQGYDCLSKHLPNAIDGSRSDTFVTADHNTLESDVMGLRAIPQ